MNEFVDESQPILESGWLVAEFADSSGRVLYRQVVESDMNLSCDVPSGAVMLLVERHRAGLRPEEPKPPEDPR